MTFKSSRSVCAVSKNKCIKISAFKCHWMWCIDVLTCGWRLYECVWCVLVWQRRADLVCVAHTGMHARTRQHSLSFSL